VLLARRGISQAHAENDRQLLELFESSLAAYSEQEEALRQRLLATRTQGAHPPAEQVTSASFAPGDGASDADVLPEGQRGRPGNWPAYPAY
jgi:hypothetical protein